MPKKEIDVFGYLEEIVIKKDRDNFDWYYSGYSETKQKEIEKELEDDPESGMDIDVMRSDCYTETMARSLHSDLIAWVETGEKISRQKAVKEVDKFISDLSRGCKKEMKK